MATTKKMVLIGLAIVTGIAIGLYQKPQVRAYLERKTDQLLPNSATHATFYKWRDKQGHWQLSDSPPPTGTSYETVAINPKANALPSAAFTGKQPP
jgi:Domain of unknown function (DUF4124)